MSEILPSILRCYPFHRGRGVVVNHQLFRNYRKKLPKQIAAKIYDGQTVHVIVDDYIGSMLYLYGDLDSSISWVISQNLEPGDVFVDVGANVGVETIPAARICGPKGQVFAFEPNPTITELLKKSIQENRHSNIQLEECAVSDKPGTLYIQVPETNLGEATVSADGNASDTAVKVITLDTYEPLQNKPIKLMKVDVEGHDFEVLMGAKNLLASGNIKNLLVEIWGSDCEEIYQNRTAKLLMEYGYKPYQVVKKFSIIHQLVDISCESPKKKANDYLFRLEKN